MEWGEKTVLVLGLARSGLAVAKLLCGLGAVVTVSDAEPREKAEDAAAVLERLGVRCVFGSHPLDLLDGCDVIVKNPGIPYRIDILREALLRSIPVITEVELAATMTVAPMIGITGTNGKTTTTSLVGAMFTAADVDHVLAGNIGTPLCEVAPSAGTQTWLVTELSSFQLAGTVSFHPHIAALLNLTPAHLDYHGTMAEYRSAKLRLFANLELGDLAILNADQPDVASLAQELRADVWWFSLHTPVRPGVYLSAQEELVFAPPDRPGVTVCLAARGEIRLRGRHNLANAAAASAIALAAGLPVRAVHAALTTFAGVEHRLEFVRELSGVKWFNDSKATNPVAAIQAISAFSEPLVVILGGLERGDDLAPLQPVLEEHVKCVICIGESGDRMADTARAAGVPSVVRAGTLAEAVAWAARHAEPGDAALLSPAAASWDMFTSYEERGRIFKAAVHML